MEFDRRWLASGATAVVTGTELAQSNTEVEIADEGDSGYEVEVEKTGGSLVEVAVSDNFEAVSTEEDDD